MPSISLSQLESHYNLNIPRYVEPKITGEVLSVEEAMKRLREIAEAAFATEEKLIRKLAGERLLI